jgi:hypothetical protein
MNNLSEKVKSNTSSFSAQTNTTSEAKHKKHFRGNKSINRKRKYYLNRGKDVKSYYKKEISLMKENQNITNCKLDFIIGFIQNFSNSNKENKPLNYNEASTKQIEKQKSFEYVPFIKIPNHSDYATNYFSFKINSDDKSDNETKSEKLNNNSFFTKNSSIKRDSSAVKEIQSVLSDNECLSINSNMQESSFGKLKKVRGFNFKNNIQNNTSNINSKNKKNYSSNKIDDKVEIIQTPLINKTTRNEENKVILYKKINLQNELKEKNGVETNDTAGTPNFLNLKDGKLTELQHNRFTTSSSSQKFNFANIKRFIRQEMYASNYNSNSKPKEVEIIPKNEESGDTQRSKSANIKINKYD